MAALSRYAMAMAAAVLMVSVGMFVTVPGQADAAPIATYEFTAETGTYYEFDTNIPEGYAIEDFYPQLPLGMSLNAGGDIVGTPYMPGDYDLWFSNGSSEIRVNIYVEGPPAPQVYTSLTSTYGRISMDKDTVPMTAYQSSEEVFIADYISVMLSDYTNIRMTVVDGVLYVEVPDAYINWFNDTMELEIRPCFAYELGTYETNPTFFRNMSLEYDEYERTYTVSAEVYAPADVCMAGFLVKYKDHSSSREDFLCLKVFNRDVIGIGDRTVLCRENFVLPFNQGTALTVSGAPWLTISENIISGVAPSQPGEYRVTVSANGKWETFTLTVASKLVPTNSPTTGAIIMPR